MAVKLIENGWDSFDPGSPVCYHADGPIGRAVEQMGREAAEADFQGEPLADVLGKIATHVVQGRLKADDGVTLFKEVRDQLPDGRARFALSGALEDMDVPRFREPTLPAAAPKPLHDLMKALYEVPVVRADPKEIEALQSITDKYLAGRLSGSGVAREIKDRVHNLRHESLGDSGKFEVDRAAMTAAEEIRELKLKPHRPGPPAEETPAPVKAAAPEAKPKPVRKPAAPENGGDVTDRPPAAAVDAKPPAKNDNQPAATGAPVTPPKTKTAKPAVTTRATTRERSTTMASIPPNLAIQGDDAEENAYKIAETLRGTFMQTSNWCETLANQLKIDLAHDLREEGLDGGGRMAQAFGRGDAARTAAHIAQPLYVVQTDLSNAAQSIVVFGNRIRVNYFEAIRAARRMRQRPTGARVVVH